MEKNEISKVVNFEIN